MKSSSPAALRLMSDYQLILRDPPEGASAAPQTEDNLFVWNATIFGPDETPWEGGIFSLKLIFPDTYPEKPPRIRFTSEIFHPNIYIDGSICLDIIQEHWSPIYTISSILTSIQSLLNDPNITSPANPQAATLFRDNFKEYCRAVRKCASKSTAGSAGINING